MSACNGYTHHGALDVRVEGLGFRVFETCRSTSTVTGAFRPFKTGKGTGEVHATALSEVHCDVPHALCPTNTCHALPGAPVGLGFRV